MKKTILFLTNENTFAVILTATVFFMIYLLRAQGLEQAENHNVKEQPQELLIKPNIQSVTFVEVKE